MASRRGQSDFTVLWDRLPQASHPVWQHSAPGRGQQRQKRLREVYQWLCAALCQLELAAKLGDFPVENMEKLLGVEHGEPLPWKDWLEKTHSLSVQSGEHQLTMHYTFTCAIERPKMFLQSLLLANGALRLAGVFDRLKGLDKTGLYFGEPTTILNVSGKFKSSVFDHTGNFKKPYDEKKLQYLIMLALRDALMPGETAEKDKIHCLKKAAKKDENMRRQLKRRLFRELWVKGNFEPRLPYSPAVIASACREIAEEFINVAPSYL
jgi:hypothetical protein